MPRSSPNVVGGRVSLFEIEIDRLTLAQSVQRLMDWVDQPAPECRYVVTPNIDHVVMLKHDRQFRRAYRKANLVVADGWPVVLASRLLGKRLPGLVPGSDLTPQLFAAWPAGRPPLNVFLLGAMPGVAEVAARNIERDNPNTRVSDVYSPPLGFEYDELEGERILQRVADANPDVLVVGVGAPKQELWVYRHRKVLKAKVALCVGATIDFLAGEKQRAPEWMRSSGLEWLHRVASEPRRLVKRYLRDAREFPQIVAAEWLAGRRWSNGSGRTATN